MRKNPFFLIIIVALQSAVVHASGGALHCPPYVVVQQEAKEVPKGWHAFEPSSKHPLMSVEFSEGEPTHKVTLLPTEEQGASAVWTFTPSAEGYWVSCGYNSTSIVMSRKLPDGTTSCRVEYDTGFNTPLPRSLRCTERTR